MRTGFEWIACFSVTTLLIGILMLLYNTQKPIFQGPMTPTVLKRDIAVLENPLYPPLNRTDSNTFESVISLPRFESRPDRDSYHLVGYLSQANSQDSGKGAWKVFGRQRRGSSDFYIVPVNKDIDVKVPFGSVYQTKIRDIFDMPSEISLQGPFGITGLYTFTELPKTDFTSYYL